VTQSNSIHVISQKNSTQSSPRMNPRYLSDSGVWMIAKIPICSQLSHVLSYDTNWYWRVSSQYYGYLSTETNSRPEDRVKPLNAHCCHMGTAILCQTGLSRHL